MPYPSSKEVPFRLEAERTALFTVEELHRASLRGMNMKYARVLDTDEVLKELEPR